MATMRHNGYIARIDYDEDREVFHGRVVNLKHLISFEGKTPRQLKSEFAEAVEFYLDICKRRNLEPERPYSGQFVLRVNPELHRSIAVAAERDGQSLNSWAKEALADAAAAE